MNARTRSVLVPAVAVAAIAGVTARANAAPAWTTPQHYEARQVGAVRVGQDTAGDTFVVWKTQEVARGVVRHADAAWPAAATLGPASVSNRLFGSRSLSNLAANPAGDAVVAWIDARSSTLRAATSDGAGPWQSAVVQTIGRGTTFLPPTVGIADDGTAWAMWPVQERRDGVRSVMLARRARGGPWGAAFPAPAGTSGPLVVAPDGGVFVFGPGIVAVEPGGVGGFTEEATPIAPPGAPRIGVDAAGNLEAVWFDQAAHSLLGAYRAASGGWGPPEVLGSDPSAVPSRILMTRAGMVTVSFSDAGGVRAAVKLGAIPFGPVQTIATGSASLGELAGNEAGDAVLAFQQGGRQLASSSSAGSFGAPERLPTVFPPPPRFPAGVSVSLDADGNAYAAWAEQRPPHNGFGRGRGLSITATRPAGGSWSSRTVMSSHWAPYHSRFAQPVVLGALTGSGATAVWTAFQPLGPRGVEISQTPTP